MSRPWQLRPLDREAVAGLQEAIAEERADQLEQEAAWNGEEWDDARHDAVYAAQFKEAALLAGLLAARGFTQPEEALSFLAGEDGLSDPYLLTDMDKAVARIRQAIASGETIVIYGDYDVDGVTATSLLYEQLKGLGGSVKCMLPSREGDGYGLSRRAIDRIHAKGYTLIVTVDNGISAVEEAAYAASLGIDLVVTDHHLPPSVLPTAVAVVDPKREGDASPFKELCGAGVAFKLCAALEDCMPEELLEFCSDLAAIGTVADVMPLTGENRTIVKAGLQALQRTQRPGLAALLQEAGLAGRPVTADNISFGLAPRLNAAGRMDSAAAALQLILCQDEGRAAGMARQLNETNALRQETEQKIEKAVEEMIAAEPDRADDRVMLLWGRHWHQGVIGIVASRLVEKYGRPVMVVSIADNGEAKGSGRSVPGFNLHGCITACEDLLIRFGGHAMAAGLLVREENLPALRRRMNEWAARECPVIHTPPLVCDLSLRLGKVTVEEVRALERMAPFGADNPAPVFLLENAVVEAVYPVSDGRHSRLRLHQGGAGLYAVWFGVPPEQVPYQPGDAVDAAVSLSVYEGQRGAQLSGRIIELHPAGFGPDAAHQAALAEALARGADLSEEERQLLRPAREDVAALYRALKARRWHAGDLQPLCARMGQANTGRTLVALTALRQMGLVAEAGQDGARYLELVPVAGKKNLADAPILQHLEAIRTNGGEESREEKEET